MSSVLHADAHTFIRCILYSAFVAPCITPSGCIASKVCGWCVRVRVREHALSFYLSLSHSLFLSISRSLALSRSRSLLSLILSL